MGRSDPNSMTTETVDPTAENSQATYPGTRYGKGGKPDSMGQDASELTIVTSASPGVG